MKKCREEHQGGFNKGKKHGNRGPSSFYKLDSSLVFEKMNLEKGDIFVDLGCGAGDYSLRAAEIIGLQGKVYAVDVWTKMLDGINEEALRLHLTNIETVESDICLTVTIGDNCADQCLLATVMHANKMSEECKNLYPEIVRILKAGGQLSVIECKKEEMPFGPPLGMRISPEELEEALAGYGFLKQEYVDLGYYYMMLFRADS